MKNMTCRLCGSGYDFRKVMFKEYGDGLEIVFTGILSYVTEENRFRFCPACGEKLTEENFKRAE